MGQSPRDTIMQLVLTVEEGPNRGKSRVVSAGQTLTVGRIEQAGWVLRDDPMLSNVHFQLTWDGAVCRVKDLGSKMGTKVNDAAVAEAEVKPGDRVQVGRTVFRLKIQAETGSPSPAAATSPPLAAPVVVPAPAAPPSPPPVAMPAPNLPPVARMPGVSVPPPPARSAGVLKFLRAQKDPLFVVLDAAREPPMVLARVVHCPLENQSLYEGLQGEALACYGPYLVSVPKESDFLSALVQDGWGRSWGVYLTSRQSFKEVRRHLRRFLEVKLPTGEKVFFRYYDPRVLRVYLPTCSEKEWRDFAGPISAYILEGDRPNAVWEFAAAEPHPRPRTLNV